MKTLQVSAIKHKDIRGKEQLYIMMQNEQKKQVIINVGKKTYDSVNELTGTLLTEDQQHKELEHIPERGIQEKIPETTETSPKEDTIKKNRTPWKQ